MNNCCQLGISKAVMKSFLRILMVTIWYVSTRDEKDEVTFAFPDVLAYRNTLECYRLSDVDVNVSKGEIISALYEVKNSNYLDWIANAGYRQIYGEPTDLRHMLIYLDDYVWDVIIHSNNGEVYYIRDGVKTTL